MDLTARRDTTSVEEVMERRAVSAPARGALGARPFDAGETPQAVSCIRVSCSSPFDTRVEPKTMPPPVAEIHCHCGRLCNASIAGMTRCPHIPSDLVVNSYHHMLRAAQPFISR